MELMTFTMGDYLKSIKSSFFTYKARHAGAAIPELADKKGVRVLISGEPEEGDPTHPTLPLANGEDAPRRPSPVCSMQAV